MIPAEYSASHYLRQYLMERHPKNLAATAEAMLAAGADVLGGPDRSSSLDWLLDYARSRLYTKCISSFYPYRSFVLKRGEFEVFVEESWTRQKELRKTFKLFIDSMPATAESMKQLLRAMLWWSNDPWNREWRTTFFNKELCLILGNVEMLTLQRTFVRKLVEWWHLLPKNMLIECQ